MLRPKVTWRSGELGEMRELELPQCTMRSYVRGTGEPLVFLHGMLQNSNIWRKAIARLGPDFRCISLDLPMGGHLTPMPRADLTLRGIARIVVDAMDALGIARATFVGNDTGTAICQILATSHPEHTDGLVLTSGDFGRNSPARFFWFIPPLAHIPGGTLMYLGPGVLPLRAMDRLPIAYGWLAKRKQDPEAVITYFQPAVLDRGIRKDYERFARAYRNEYALRAASRLPDFDGPALIAWSSEDRFFPPADAERLAELLPNARLEWIDDSYTISSEDQPEHLASLVQSFMRERVKPELSTA